MKQILICGLTALLGAGLPAAAQSNPAPIKGMASTVGLYVYPDKQQSATQQLTDESQCYSNAKTQTGFDPNATTTAAKTPDQKDSGKGDKSVAHSAARGAAVAGATGGDPAAGARRGALIGEAKSKHKQKQEAEQADKTADATKSAADQQLDNFKRSLSACLEARGYSVK